MAVTAVTRRALLADFRARNIAWSADCDEVEFLGRLYDLDKLPSTDARCETAREDAIQHLLANADWDLEFIFADARFGLSTGNDEPLLRFLAETLHPAVRTDRVEVSRLFEIFNGHLRPDGLELFQESVISGRPVFSWRPVAPPTVSLEQIRAAIADAIYPLKSYEVEEFCTTVAGLPPSTGDDDDPHSSKRGYVRRRLTTKSQGELLDIAERVLARLDDAALRSIVDSIRAGGERSRLGSPKNLVFASIGPKHKIVLSDAIDNDMRIVENDEFHLSYSEPVGDSGLTWRQLVAWWPHNHGDDERTRALALHARLWQSLDPGPEQLILQTYAKLYKRFGFDIPALLPQVYLHYDPYSRRSGAKPPLARQRMDFLLLVPLRRRVVIELDGQQHYSAPNGQASPQMYGEMMREDRRLRLSGYELYRFGGHELHNPTVGETLLHDFFVELLRNCDVTLDG